MPDKARILMQVVAYEAEATLAQVLDRIPDDVRDNPPPLTAK
jgi:hypothetical protein